MIIFLFLVLIIKILLLQLIYFNFTFLKVLKNLNFGKRKINMIIKQIIFFLSFLKESFSKFLLKVIEIKNKLNLFYIL